MKWVVLSVSDAEEAKCDTDLTYSPVEHIAGYLEAHDHDGMAERALAKSIKTGRFHRSSIVRRPDDMPDVLLIDGRLCHKGTDY
jgi:hypothetical protein